MELEKVKKILKDRRYKYSEKLSDLDDEYDKAEVYEKGDKRLVEICYTLEEGVWEIFISIPEYDFRTDSAGRIGINLQEGNNTYCLTEETLLYCLEMQECSRKHTLRFCMFYLEYTEWANKELIPVLEFLEIKDAPLYTTEEDYIQLPLAFSYEGKYVDFWIDINPLTFKVSITLKKVGHNTEENLDYLYGEPSDIIYATLQDYGENCENALTKVSNP